MLRTILRLRSKYSRLNRPFSGLQLEVQDRPEILISKIMSIRFYSVATDIIFCLQKGQFIYTSDVILRG